MCHPCMGIKGSNQKVGRLSRCVMVDTLIAAAALLDYLNGDRHYGRLCVVSNTNSSGASQSQYQNQLLTKLIGTQQGVQCV